MVADIFTKGVVILGAGNVATHLAQALKIKGVKITCIYSRSEDSAKQLADKINTKYQIQWQLLT